MSLRKMVKENHCLHEEINAKKLEIDDLKIVVEALKYENRDLKENNSYLVNQVREAEKANNELTSDLELSTE